MTTNYRIRFSLMMFLQYIMPGCLVPIFSHYLQNYIGFTPGQVGIILAMPPLSALLALPIAAHLADRYISAEHLLAVCNLVTAVISLLLVREDQYIPFVCLYLLYGMSFMPTLALTNAVVLHHTKNPKRDFGAVRLWGTGGWVFIAFTFGYGWLGGGGDERLPHALILAAIVGVVMAAYCLTLPRAPEEALAKTTPEASRALPIFLTRNMMIFCVLSVLNAMVHQFYYFGMAPYLAQNGYSNASLLPLMSMGQLAEMGFMAVLGGFIERWGMKRVMLAGAAAQGLRTLVFAFTSDIGYVLPAIALHGMCYAFFFTAGYIFLNEHTTAQTRAGAQQIYTIVISGFGQLLGFLAAGRLAEWFTLADGDVDYGAFWVASSVLSLAVVVGLVFGLRDTTPPPPTPTLDRE